MGNDKEASMNDTPDKTLVDIFPQCCILYIFVLLTMHFKIYSYVSMQFQIGKVSHIMLYNGKQNDDGLQIKVRKF